MAGRPEAIEHAMVEAHDALGMGTEQYAQTVATEVGVQQAEKIGGGLLGVEQEAFELFTSEAFELFTSFGGSMLSWPEVSAADRAAQQAAVEAAERIAARNAAMKIHFPHVLDPIEEEGVEAGLEGAAEVGAQRAAMGAAEMAGELAFDSAVETAALTAEGFVAGALNVLPIVGQIASAALLFVTVRCEMLKRWHTHCFADWLTGHSNHSHC